MARIELRVHSLGLSLPCACPRRGRRHSDYASASYYNRLDFQGPVVFAWDRDPATRAAVCTAHPGRRVYTIEGKTLTHGGYRILSSQVDH